MRGHARKRKRRRGAFLALAVEEPLAVEEAPVVNGEEEVMVVAVEEGQVLDVVVVAVEEAQVLEVVVVEDGLIQDRHSIICVIQTVDRIRMVYYLFIQLRAFLVLLYLHIYFVHVFR